MLEHLFHRILCWLWPAVRSLACNIHISFLLSDSLHVFYVTFLTARLIPWVLRDPSSLGSVCVLCSRNLWYFLEQLRYFRLSCFRSQHRWPYEMILFSSWLHLNLARLPFDVKLRSWLTYRVSIDSVFTHLLIVTHGLMEVIVKLEYFPLVRLVYSCRSFSVSLPLRYGKNIWFSSLPEPSYHRCFPLLVVHYPRISCKLETWFKLLAAASKWVPAECFLHQACIFSSVHPKFAFVQIK